MTETNAESRMGRRFGAGEISLVGRLIDELAGPNRRMRQEASHTLAEMAREHPQILDDELDSVVPALIEALERPEAQTRWEALDALAALAPAHPAEVSQAFDGAEASLFDEGPASVRISAFRLLARLAATSEELSDKVWPLLDEAIQCYHGDQGYRDMLAVLLELVRGNASRETKEALAARIAFDATSGHGYVKARSAEIIAVVKGE